MALIVTKCAKCGLNATNKCGRCNITWYCSRDCQLDHWKTHKTSCLSPEMQKLKYAKYMEFASKRIEGNIYILAAHKYSKYGPGVIMVEIGETIEEFIKTNSLHFANLKYASRDNYKEYIKNQFNINIEDINFDNTINVVFILKNYHLVMKLEQKNLETIKNKNNDPAASDNWWSVLFEF